MEERQPGADMSAGEGSGLENQVRYSVAIGLARGLSSTAILAGS